MSITLRIPAVCERCESPAACEVLRRILRDAEAQARWIEEASGRKLPDAVIELDVTGCFAPGSRRV
jgi:hypothetical protein